MRIELTHNERLKILSVVTCWERKQITQEVFRNIQRKSGIPARLVEITFWHLDTLDVLSEVEWLVFKGGTCVQSHLPSGYQRASVDLDFNSTIENPNTILAAIEEINERIRKTGKYADIHGIKFGIFEFKGDDKHSGTLNFSRRLPSRFGELERQGETTIQAKSVRVQINYRHVWLPALNPVLKQPDLFILGHEKPQKDIFFMHSSLEDLIVDKILTTCQVGSFGRERFKDVYDLGMMLKRDFEEKKVWEKLKLVGKHSKQESLAFVRGAVETVSSFAQRSQEAGGFASMVCRQGRKVIIEWEVFCMDTTEALEDLM